METSIEVPELLECLGISVWDIVEKQVDRFQFLAEQREHLGLVTNPEVPTFLQGERHGPTGK
jgi:hypothetical protein